MGSPYATAAYKRARLAAIERAKGGGRKPVCEACGTPITGRVHTHHVHGVERDPEHHHLKVLHASCHEVVEIIKKRRGNLSRAAVVILWEIAQEGIE